MFTRKRIVNIAICVLVILVCVAVTFAATVDSKVVPEVVVLDGNPVTGTTGVSITEQDCDSSTHVYLINGTQLGPTSGWLVGGSEFIHNATYCPDGLHVNLSAYGSAESASVAYSRTLYFAVENYSSADASLMIESISGIFRVTLRAYWEYPVEHDWATGTNVTSAILLSGSNGSISVGIPIQAIASSATSLVFSVDVTMGVETDSTSSGDASFLVRNVVVEAESESRLSPVHVDLQTSYGSSIYGNPELIRIRHPPFMNLTRQGDGRYAFVRPQGVNDTLFLPAANYSAIVGWPTSSSSHYTENPQSLALEVRENKTVLIVVRLSTIRVEFSYEPRLFFTYMEVHDYGDTYYAFYRLNGVLPRFLYLPGDSRTFSFQIIEEVPWDGWYGRQANCYIVSNGSTDFELDFIYPYLLPLGVAMTVPDSVVAILLFLFLGAVVLKTYPTWLNREQKRVFLDPGTTAFLIVFASAFLPWFRYDEHTVFGYPVSYFPRQGIIMIPLLVFLKEMPMGPIIPAVLDLGTFLPVIFMFWPPLLLWLSLLRRLQKAPKWVGLSGMAFPLLLAQRSMEWGSSYQLSPDIGIYLVMLSPIVYVVLVGVQRLNGRPSMHTDDEAPQA